jgi:hypothetical protein
VKAQGHEALRYILDAISNLGQCVIGYIGRDAMGDKAGEIGKSTMLKTFSSKLKSLAFFPRAMENYNEPMERRSFAS